MQELKIWFKTNPFPDAVPELLITDTKKFLNSHFSVLKGSANEKFKTLHVERLEYLKKHLTNEK